MSLEARQILKEHGQRTIADESFVGQLTEKWEGFLDGMPSAASHDKYVRGVTAMLMENQANYMGGLTEDIRSINVGSFTKFIFPILRRVFPNLIANEIVSVQPMTAPIGAVFFMDYVYGTTKGQTVEGNVFPRDFDRDYSSEFINGEAMVVGDGAAFTGASTIGAKLSFTPVRPLDAARGFSVSIREIAAADGSTVQEVVDDGAGAFTGDISAAGTINYSNGSITGLSFAAAPAAGNIVRAYYYYDGELNSQIPQINLDIKKAPVEAVPRRVKALWSSEAAEDLRAYHGVEAESELVSAVAQKMALEIDREIIQNLFAVSVGTVGVFDRVPPAGISELDHLRSMLTEIATVSNTIHRKTLRAPANWIVTSPDVSALLSQLTTHGDFRAAWTGSSSPYGPVDMIRPGGTPHGQFGIYKAGTLQNKWVIYEDPFFTRDQMMIGLKGDSYLDAGYVWAPYIPLQITNTFLDPSDMSFRKGFRTRYATKLLRQDFYGQLRVQNL